MLPELWVGGLALMILFSDLAWKGSGHRTIGLLTAIGLIPLVPILLQHSGSEIQLFHGMYRVDALSRLFKEIFTVTAIFVLLMTRETSRNLPHGHGEFYLLILMATLGMFFVASSGNFLMLFVSLELVTLSFYVMTAYLKTDPRSLEAGLKYLILGSIASSFFLYGIAFLYGSTGSIQFSEVRAAIAQAGLLPTELVFALIMILGAVAFKAGVVPFHLWIPDVYEGAPTPVTAFLSVGSKSAGMLVALRILHELFLPANFQWAALLACIAGVTILYGNLSAIPQKNIKRLLGYSSIGHAGYLLIGIATANTLGSTGVNFYLMSYLFTNLAVFLVVTTFFSHVGSDEMRDYAGLSRRSPFLAAAMFLALLSLAGVPPLAGFFGKFILLMSAVSVSPLWEGYLWLAVIGAAAVVISLYYYLLLVKTMYVDLPNDPSPIPVSLSMRFSLIVCMVGMVGIGCWQAPFLQFAFSSIKGFF